MSGGDRRRLLVDFSEPAEGVGWEVLDDVVMGGRSRGRAEIVGGRMRFSGELVTEGGGFSSVRSTGCVWDLSDAEVLILVVRGEGRRYQVLLDTGVRIDGGRVTYRAAFHTRAGRRQEVDLELRELVPMRRGTELAGPVFDPAKVLSIGLLLADGSDGSFALDVERIEVELESRSGSGAS